MSEFLGMNRTGTGMSPLDAPDTVEAAATSLPTSGGDSRDMALLRGSYVRDADPIGTLPPPTTLRGMAKTAASLMKGKNATILIDRLGQRLAFERTGVRLYESLLTKLDEMGSWDGGPSHDALLQIHNEEHSHLETLKNAILMLGADPTVQTPAADIAGVAAMGIIQVLNDPRTSLAQCLEVMLTVELTDNDAWDSLIELADSLGQTEMVTSFRAARLDEADHLRLVRAWMANYLRQDANAEIPMTQA